MFTEQELQEGQKYQALGPHYFSSRRIVEGAMQSLSDRDMQEVIKTFVDDAYRKLQQAVEDSLWSDAEVNLQNQMWRTVDEIVKGILSGERWAMERYALGPKYECDKIRKAVAKHIPDELAAARIADLEAELARVNEDLKRAREWR